MRISDWSSDVCSSDLHIGKHDLAIGVVLHLLVRLVADAHRPHPAIAVERLRLIFDQPSFAADAVERLDMPAGRIVDDVAQIFEIAFEHVERAEPVQRLHGVRSEEHTSELQSLMRISYAVFCLKKKKKI